ncbi:uncharacterized protein DUF4157 [Chitinophaga polysaccharea]|uniref:Uncharacterized protein DUF4157 n=1 Tax=Chitinophaga polysaccharea TaxID=1293035 RepID=A0A561P1B7_9BACT|nr:DUF4157 domain-containing protein [Chitinophaga polysaccharea]TWF31854.1 uncharacterized protein DUF4157 [Chitinophaga polysaccharea]
MVENFGKIQQQVPTAKASANNAPAGGISIPAANGLPAQLKVGVEALSGISMDDVSVHYNSDKPAQMKAFAYTQGTDIHVAPGQEKHLPHEAWHVVQQKQGRVQATRQMKSIAINDDAMLEREADVMGAKALQTVPGTVPLQRMSVSGSVAQFARRTGLFGIEAEVVDGVFIIGAKKGREGQNLIESEDITLEEFSLGEIDGRIDVTLDNEMKKDNGKYAYRQYVIEFVQKAVDPLSTDPDGILKVANAWEKAGDFWRAAIGNNRDLLHGRVSPDWYTLNPTWKGGQFDAGDQQPHPGVTSKGDNNDKEFEFDWRHHAFTSYITVDKEDPAVSAQATAGSSLGSLVEAFLITHQILAKGEVPEEDFWTGDVLADQRRNEVLEPAVTALSGLLFILKSYVTATGSDIKRYAKEYLPFMSRTSLDMAYSQLSASAKQAFIVMVQEYLSAKPGNQLTKTFGKAPTDRVFTPDTSKEEQAHSITIEQMLLSVINKKKGDLGALVAGDNAAGGDVFSHNHLAGISEINPRSQEAIEKFKLNAANEMMRGEAGIIFESRSAKRLLLSEMPKIYIDLLTSLQRMDKVFNDVKSEVAAEQAPRPQPRPQQAAKRDDKRCLLM